MMAPFLVLDQASRIIAKVRETPDRAGRLSGPRRRYVEVGDDLWRAAPADGSMTLIDGVLAQHRPDCPVELALIRAHAEASIDLAAEQHRQRAGLVLAPGHEQERRQSEAEARRYLADCTSLGQPDLAQYPLLAADAHVMGADALVIARRIIANADHAAGVHARIKEARRRAKEAVRAATSANHVRQIMADFPGLPTE